MPSTLHEKALEYGTSSHFFLPVKLWCLCENEHRFKLTGWFYTNYHNIDYGRSQWWQAVGMATKFKCLCKFIKGLWIRSWEIQTGEDLKQRGRGRQGPFPSGLNAFTSLRWHADLAEPCILTHRSSLQHSNPKSPDLHHYDRIRIFLVLVCPN